MRISVRGEDPYFRKNIFCFCKLHIEVDLWYTYGVMLKTMLTFVAMLVFVHDVVRQRSIPTVACGEQSLTLGVWSLAVMQVPETAMEEVSGVMRSWTS